MEINIGDLMSSALGALIGSSLTLAGVWVSHKLHKSEEERREKEHIDGLLEAIHDEVKTLWDAYSVSAGRTLENLQDGEAFLSYWPITQEYFTIYTNNAIHLSKLKDSSLRRRVVTTYTKARGLIDSYRMNNEMLRQYENASILFGETQKDIYKRDALTRYQGLQEYALRLRALHNELNILIFDLIQNLENRNYKLK